MILKNIDSSKIFKFALIIFVLFHLLIININAAEWGDSYRILRASNFIRDFSYPLDEKRPPLFSIYLATWPALIDPVFWGRMLMMVVSSGSLYYSYKIFRLFKGNATNFADLVFLSLLILNPVYTYWSIRIMADVPFSFLTLVTFYYLLVWKKSFTPLRLIFLGLFVGLSVLTRFEGYILFGALGLGIVFNMGIKSLRPNYLFNSAKKSITNVLYYLLGFFVATFPYYVFRNPLTSTYFEEPGRRVYNFETFLIFALSLLFLFGFTSAFYFFIGSKQFSWKKFFVSETSPLVSFIKSDVGIASFIAVEILLVLVWPAAVPRLFVPIVPLLLVPLALSIDNYFFARIAKPKFSGLVGLGALILVYVVGQYFLKMQFLVLFKPVFVLIVLLQLVNVFSIYSRRANLFYVSLIISAFVWSLATIWLHKDIFKVVKEANVFVKARLCGNIATNDVSSISDWYLNQYNPHNEESCRKGIYLDLTDKANREYDLLVERDISYAIITNEHNTDTTVDLSSWPHLEELVEFEAEINGKRFFTKVIKFNR